MDMKENLSALAIVREYENSVDLPASERLTYLNKQGEVCWKSDTVNYEECINKYSEYLRFGDEVDLATCGGMNPINQLKICDTPELFLEAGFEQRPMLYTQRHLLDAVHPKSEDNYHYHGLKIEQIKRLPQLIESPVMLSDNPSRSDTLLVVLPEVDSDKLPLIVSIKPNGHGSYSLQEIETNIILTVFGKNDFEKYFESVITPEKIIYFNEKQGHKLEALAERQLFRCHPITHDLDKAIIRYPQCIVNQKSAHIAPKVRPSIHSEHFAQNAVYANGRMTSSEKETQCKQTHFQPEKAY